MVSGNQVDWMGLEPCLSRQLQVQEVGGAETHAWWQQLGTCALQNTAAPMRRMRKASRPLRCPHAQVFGRADLILKRTVHHDST